MLSHRWRELFRWPQFVGLAMFLAVGRPGKSRIASASGRKTPGKCLAATSRPACGTPAGQLLEAPITYPVDVVICMLPWSILLLPYLRRDFRKTSACREDVRFLAVRSPSRFSPVGSRRARNRYFAPLFPCVAPLIGLVVQRCADEPGAAWANAWRHFLTVIGFLMPVLGAWVMAATLLGWGLDWGQQPLGFAIVYGLAALMLGILALWSAGRRQLLGHCIGIVCVTAFLGLSWSGVVMNVLAAIRDPIVQDIADLKQRLPKDARLVSIGMVDCRFLYYYGEPIEWLPEHRANAPPIAEGTYFCMVNAPSRLECDFPYEEVALISCHADPMPQPTEYVVIARRLPVVYSRRAE